VSLPYLVVGWTALVAIPQLVRGLGGAGFTLIVVGGHTQEISPALAAWQIAAETERPARLPFEAFATIV